MLQEIEPSPYLFQHKYSKDEIDQMSRTWTDTDPVCTDESIISRSMSTTKGILHSNLLPTWSQNSHLHGGKILHYYYVHPLLIILTIVFLVAYFTKFIGMYFHNLAAQTALIQHGEPISCMKERTYHTFNNRDETSLPSAHDAFGALWDMIGYSKRSTECEEWYKKINEWNIPDPSDVAWLVITSTFTQPISFLVDALSLSIETFFNRQSILVTILIFILTGYILKLIFTSKLPRNMYVPHYILDDLKMYSKR